MNSQTFFRVGIVLATGSMARPADLVVINGIRSVLTVVGGKVVYEAKK